MFSDHLLIPEESTKQMRERLSSEKEPSIESDKSGSGVSFRMRIGTGMKISASSLLHNFSLDDECDIGSMEKVS